MLFVRLEISTLQGNIKLEIQLQIVYGTCYKIVVPQKVILEKEPKDSYHEY